MRSLGFFFLLLQITQVSSNLRPRVIATVFTQYVRRTVEQKLTPIPTYAICSAGGYEYYLPRVEGQASLCYFLDYEDAVRTLTEMKLQQAGQFSDARIKSKSLHSVLKQANKNPFHDEPPASPTVKIVPSTRQVAKATYRNEFRRGREDQVDKVGKYINRKKGHCKIPCFQAEHLYLTRKGEEPIAPLFMSFEDLQEAWNRKHFSGEDPSAPVPELQWKVHDLCGILDVMKRPYQFGTKFDLKSYGIVPSSRSIALFEEALERSPPPRKSRLHVRL